MRDSIGEGQPMKADRQEQSQLAGIAPQAAAPSSNNRRVLQCMDIWSGNELIEKNLAAPGAEIFVSSKPYRGERRGGDVYYLSLCAGGAITRLILADVAGHGEAVAETSQSLRALLRRHINAHSQKRLVHDLNREFTRLSESGAFATAVVAAYFSHERRLSLCNAGHPRPLWYRKRSASWSAVDNETSSTESAANFPLGVVESTRYRQSTLHVEDGDLLVFYTDALIEARDAADQLIGESGLQTLATALATDDARQFGEGLLAALKLQSGRDDFDDDATLIVLRFDTALKRTPSVKEKLVAYGKLLHLLPT